LRTPGFASSEAIEVRWVRDLKLDDRPALNPPRQYTDRAVRTPKSAAGRRDLPLSTGMADRLRAIEGPAGTLAFTTITGKRLNRSSQPARTSSRSRSGSGTLTQASPSAPTSTSWTRARATPTSSTTSWVTDVPFSER
jgi:hypothetical protein